MPYYRVEVKRYGSSKVESHITVTAKNKSEAKKKAAKQIKGKRVNYGGKSYALCAGKVV